MSYNKKDIFLVKFDVLLSWQTTVCAELNTLEV